MRTFFSCLLVTAWLVPGLPAQVVEHPLDSAEGLQLINVKAEVVELDGLEGLRVQIGLWLHESTLAHFRNLRFAAGG